MLVLAGCGGDATAPLSTYDATAPLSTYTPTATPTPEVVAKEMVGTVWVLLL